MSKTLIIGLIIGGILIILISRYVWMLFGKPYPRLHLIGTDYIKNSDELYILNEQQNEPYFFVKKYKYSKNIMLIGFGGGSIRTDDFYGLGIADINKKQILSPNYKFLYAKLDYKTNEIYIHCMPHKKTGNEPDEYYKIENNKVILLKNIT